MRQAAGWKKVDPLLHKEEQSGGAALRGQSRVALTCSRQLARLADLCRLLDDKYCSLFEFSFLFFPPGWMEQGKKKKDTKI